MNLYVSIKQVNPETDYTAVCFEVKDADSGEIIWRTADRAKAEELVGNFNSGKDSGVLKAKLEHQRAAHDRLKARYKRAVSALKDFATCGTCADCGLCGKRTCPDSTYVDTSRAVLSEIGLKIPLTEEGKYK